MEKHTPEQFQQLILAYQQQKSEIDALLQQQKQLEKTIESKFGFSSLNLSYEFPRLKEECIGRESSHPSLLTSNFNLNDYAKKAMQEQSSPELQSSILGAAEHASQPRKIMGVRDIRQIVRNNSNKENEGQDLQLTCRTTCLNDSPKSTKRQIKSISKELIKEIKGFESRANGILQSRNINDSLNRTERKINIELSIDRKHRMLTDRRKEPAGLETPKALLQEGLPNTGMRRIQSFKNIVQSNRKQQEKTEESLVLASAQASCKTNCINYLEEPSKVAKTVKGIHRANLNLFVQKRQIKIITAGSLNKTEDQIAGEDHSRLKQHVPPAVEDTKIPVTATNNSTRLKGLAWIGKHKRP